MPVPSSLNLQPEHEKLSETSSESNPSTPTPPGSQESNEESQQNKLFVGALSWETKEDALQSFFAKYGEIVECSIMRDLQKKSRGFAFITFKDSESVQNILDSHAKEPLNIDDKEIDPKLAVPRRRNNKVRRIFVGGLSSDTSEEDMREFFLQFGNIEEVQLMYDRQTNRHRGFGFVTFEKPGPAEKVCSIQFHDIKGKKVEVKVAQTKEALAMQAGKARAAAFTHGYGAATAFNYSPTYPPFYPHYPLDIYNGGPQIMLGSKPRGKVNQFSPPAYYGGYSYPTDHHITSPPFFPSGFNGLPGPFFMRGLPEPSSMPLGSPSMDFVEQFQALALMGNPYLSPTQGSPPSSFTGSLPTSSLTYQNGVDGTGTNYSPPAGLSPKGSPTGTPINGYTQVPHYSTSKGSYNIQQTSA